MNLLDRILEKQGLNYEDLNHEEREVYNKANFNMKSLSVGDVKHYVSLMKNSVALQISDTPIDETNKIIILQARLKNYVLLEAFLMKPEIAEKAFRAGMEAKGVDRT